MSSFHSVEYVSPAEYEQEKQETKILVTLSSVHRCFIIDLYGEEWEFLFAMKLQYKARSFKIALALLERLVVIRKVSCSLYTNRFQHLGREGL